VACDWVSVRDVFVNLINNALKYNDKPVRRLEIGYWKPGEPDPPLDTFTGNTPPIIFYVRDNGIGIDPRHQEQVFKIFKRLHIRDAYGGGTGAGLAIVRLLVERHQGKVWLTSKPGEGSTFYFTLGDKPQ
jgi:signal transduction histidine kinase